MFTTICAYVLIGLFFVVEGRTRKGADAKSMKAGQFDQDSTKFVGLAFGSSLITLLLAPLLNYIGLGRLDNSVGVIGLALMVIGLVLRYWATQTLGAYYSRTLLIKTEQSVVDNGPYRWIRNPG